ncbi:hypothetical protein [Parachitinimonas caeni]|uniref:Carotenoid biosynthesis protein n=1 Tax=Parachitinimonas caeni TaxID=3031301 RepID=A0ABT7DSR7_9NEIS|nr:hypothetical protein [Parachitinimonas caeni]MDK2122814.1 hypothetical protein [Parachitinimonas caeni]
MITAISQHSLSILRQPGHFSWSIIPLMMLVIYLYSREADRGNWNRVLAGLALVGMDGFNEIVNGLVFHFSQYAPIWGISGQTSLLLLMGLNIEILFGFFIMGLTATLLLPADPKLKWFGINNRLIVSAINCVLCVLVEITLNWLGVLTWEWPWWNGSHPWGIFLFGYLPFFLVSYWVYDMPSRRRQIAVVASIFCFDIVVGGSLLAMGWI